QAVEATQVDGGTEAIPAQAEVDAVSLVQQRLDQGPQQRRVDVGEGGLQPFLQSLLQRVGNRPLARARPIPQDQGVVAEAVLDLVVVELDAEAVPDAVAQAEAGIVAPDVLTGDREVAVAVCGFTEDAELGDAEAAAEIPVLFELGRL